MTKEGIIDAPPLNLSCGDKAYLTDKPVKVEIKKYLKVKPIDPKKFSIWHDVNGCDETTLAITPLKSERQAKAIQKEIMRNASDLIFWQGELLHHFGEVSLIDVIYYAKKYKRLMEIIEQHIKSNKAKIVPYGDSSRSSVVEELENIIEEIEK